MSPPHTWLPQSLGRTPTSTLMDNCLSSSKSLKGGNLLGHLASWVPAADWEPRCQSEFLSGIQYCYKSSVYTAKDTRIGCFPPDPSVSHAWGLLCRNAWCGLARQGVHGPQELVCNPSGFSQPTQQSTMDSGWVVTDCMFSSKEESWNWLFQERKKNWEKNQVANSISAVNGQIPVGLPITDHHPTKKGLP